MDELPDLRTDEDVDALMARLREKLGPHAPPASGPPSAHEPSGDAWRDFLTAQGEFTSTMLRAVSVLADAVDELREPAAGITVNTSKPARRRARSSTKALSRKGQRRIRR